MNWKELLGLSVPITGLVITVYLVILGFQFPKISKTSEDVAVLKKTLGNTPTQLTDLNNKVIRLETALGTAPDKIRANTDQLKEATWNFTRNFQNLEKEFTTVSTNLQTAQTTISQSTADISGLRDDFKNLNQKNGRSTKGLPVVQ